MCIVEISFEYMTEFFLKGGIESSLCLIALVAMGMTMKTKIKGNVFVSNPHLMLSDVYQNIMREIFHGQYMNFQKDLLKILLLLLRNDQVQDRGIYDHI